MTEMIHDDHCPWPYFQAYGLVARPIQKPKRKKRAPRSTKRSWIAADLGTRKYHQRVVPNKKRKLDRSIRRKRRLKLSGDTQVT